MEEAIKKVVSAFKGFVLSHELLPYDAETANTRMRTRSGPRPTFKFIDSDEGPRQVYVDSQKINRVIDMLERVFPDQVDRALASQMLMDALDSWLGMQPDQLDMKSLEDSATEFIDRVRGEFKSYLVYLPAYGIRLSDPKPIDLGKARLFMNGPGTQLKRRLEERREALVVPDEMVAPIDNAPCFFEVAVSGHFRRAIQTARAETDAAVNLLLLFIGRYYFDRHENTLGGRGIRIGSPGSEPLSNIAYVAHEDATADRNRLGAQMDSDSLDAFEINSSHIQNIRRMGLDEINRLLALERFASNDPIANRIRVSIEWFGRGVAAGSLAESFLCIAISIEALLSEGRSSKEKYSAQISALILRNAEVISPVNQPISASLAMKLKAGGNSTAFTRALAQRIIELFEVRNLLAHGGRTQSDVDPLDQLDFESIVRCAILSYVSAGWVDFGDFKSWYNKQRPGLELFNLIIMRMKRILRAS